MAETFWPDPAAAALELKGRWAGRYVDLTDWSLADNWGGAGVVIDVVTHDGRVWLQLDWGMELVVTPDAAITEQPEPDHDANVRLKMPDDGQLRGTGWGS